MSNLSLTGRNMLKKLSCAYLWKDGPALGAYWALQHVTVNPMGLGLTPGGVAERMRAAGFVNIESIEMIARMTKVVVAFKP